jgi:integration host factor subunit alpha
MTKADLIELVYERVGCSKKEAGEVVEEVFAIVRECLRRGEKVKISGFGTLAVNQKRARLGRNPQTGEAITIKPRAVFSFKPSEILKDRVLNATKSG